MSVPKAASPKATSPEDGSIMDPSRAENRQSGNHQSESRDHDDKALSRGDQRRRAIVEAATAIFLESGFAGTTLDKIIERSGGSRRTLYEHFGNKEGLFSAVLCRCCERVLESVNELDLYAMPPRDALTLIGERVLRSLTEPNAVAVYRAVVSEVSRFPEIGDIFYKHGPMVGYGRLADYLRHQASIGALKVRDPEIGARQFIEMVKSDLHLRCIFYPGFVPDDAAIRHHVSEAVETFLNGARIRD